MRARKLVMAAMTAWLPLAALASEPEAASADALVGDAVADEADDILDEILGEDSSDRSAREEREALESGDEERAQEDETPLVWVPAPRRKVIKTLQRKSFMKIGRFEAEPHVGFVTNDPFIRRWLFGANVAYHPTEVFGIEVNFTFSPDLGDLDKKAITTQIVDNNQVTPDISKIGWYASLNLQFSPIYGKLAVLDRQVINVDVFGAFGAGVVSTTDDLEVLQKVGDPVAEATRQQIHPALNFGGGLRIIFPPTIAVRFEARGLSYIEVLESTTLELKNNVTLLLGLSLFFPGMK